MEICQVLRDEYILDEYMLSTMRDKHGTLVASFTPRQPYQQAIVILRSR